MKYAHRLDLTVYSKPEDNENEIVSGLRRFFPYSLADEKIAIERGIAGSREEKKITILRIILEKSSHINKMLSHLCSKIGSEQKDTIFEQIESRLDRRNDFFLRFDKHNLAKNNIFSLEDKGDCYHLRISIASFPKKRENAMEVVRNIFNSSMH
ncbi:hypothetical protein J4401_02220 [Candidatus Woesearchaeota archaeon]|nr:hypothetical protein [Candidatus Woesearchaeota archaeon]